MPSQGVTRLRLQNALLYTLSILITVIVLLPVLWMVTISLRPNRDVLMLPPRLFPRTPTIEGYKNVVTRLVNIRAFLNSLIVSFSVTGVSILLASFAGYGLSRFRFRGKRLLRQFILVTQMLPPIFMLVPYYVLSSWLGLYDTFFALIIAYTSFSLPFCLLMLRSFFDSIPAELDESAMIDGCTRLGSLLRIIFPITTQAIIATGAFAFIGAWTELLFAIILTRSSDMIMFTTAVATYIGQYSRNWNAIMAISILGCIPVILFWIFLQKYIIAGLTSGAVKA